MKTITENDKEFICDLNAPCFQMLKPEEVDVVRSSKTQVLYRKGDNLTKQGTFASYILYVIDGLAIQYIEDVNDKSFNLRIIQPGEFIGLSSVFTSNTFNYSSIAITDCHVFLVEKSALLEVINKNGTFGLGLITRYSEQNVNIFETLKKVMYRHMNGRMADTLLYINTLKTKYANIFKLLTRKDIADFTGVSTESAVKLLKSLEQDGIIELKGKDVVIKDAARLIDLSRRG